LDGVRELGSRISSKIADTTGTVIDRLSELFGSDPFPIPDPFSVCPILTEKTVKGTSMIKHSEVFKPIFWV
jgi:hypothetical protein